MSFHHYFFRAMCPDIHPIVTQDQDYPDADSSPPQKMCLTPATVLTYHYAK